MPNNNSTPPDGASRYRAPALEKGLDIIEFLSERPEGLSQSDIARALKRSVGEIFRMLNCLVERGYVTIQRPSDRYVLTLKLFELAHRHAPMERMLSEALPRMRELAAQVNQSCHLTVVEAGHGVVVAQVDSPGHIGFAVRVGSVMSLSSTASGHVLLAFQTSEECERIHSRETGAPKPGAPTLALLEGVRARGYEEMDSTRTRGVHDLSFPVLDHKGCAVAAMTVPFIERLDLADASSPAQVRSGLGHACALLSAAIGGRVAVQGPPFAGGRSALPSGSRAASPAGDPTASKRGR